MNNVQILGNLVRDVELRYTSTGKCVASFTVAVNEKYGDKELVSFINCIAWQKLGESCGQLKKGEKVFVLGRWTTRSYDDKQGQKRYITELNATFVGKSIDAVEQGSNFDNFGNQQQEEIPF